MQTTKTIISHFYNEEYLLPRWLSHHKKIFDHGILIDYNSTDNSVNLCKSICPNWLVVKSRNNDFDVSNVDMEVMFYESQISGWKICLNTTEFLLGNIDKNILQSSNIKQILIPQISFFDWNPDGELDTNIPLWYQKKYGIDYKTYFVFRKSRSLHNKTVRYSLGRHFNSYTSEQLLIFHYANCISSPEMLNRRLQIQSRIPYKDKLLNLGFQHYNRDGTDLNKQNLYDYYLYFKNKQMIVDQSNMINYVTNTES